MKPFRVMCMGLLGCIISGHLIAGNYSFMRDSAMSYFTNTDTNMMYSNILKTLNNNPDGKKSSWKNPSTNAWGYAVASKAPQNNGTRCRNVKIFNEAKGRSGMSNYVFCKIKGEWKII